MREAEFLVQRDARGVCSVYPADEHVQLSLLRDGNQRFQKRSTNAASEIGSCHINRVFNRIFVGWKSPKCTPRCKPGQHARLRLNSHNREVGCLFCRKPRLHGLHAPWFVFVERRSMHNGIVINREDRLQMLNTTGIDRVLWHLNRFSAWVLAIRTRPQSAPQNQVEWLRVPAG